MKKDRQWTIDCVFFDLDHVLYMSDEFLLPTLKACAQLIYEFLDENGSKKTSQEVYNDIMRIRDELGVNHQGHFNYLLENVAGYRELFASDKDRVELIEACVETYHGRKYHFMPRAIGRGAKKALEELARRGQRVAIISNGNPKKQVAKLKDIGLYEYFVEDGVERIYVSEEERVKKPYPNLWNNAQKEMGLDLKRCIMIGDMFWGDIMGANMLGMTTIKVNQGKYSHQTIKGVYKSKLQSGSLNRFFGRNIGKEEVLKKMTPDYEISSLDSLICLLDKIDLQYSRIN